MGLIILRTKTKKKQWHPWRWLIGIVVVIAVAIFAASSYFFSVAMVPGHKDFINNSTKISRNDPLYEQKMWFKHAKKEKWTMKSASGNYKLVADYIPAAKSTTKNVVIAHGFMGDKEKMGEYAALFHQMGYNVLMPDARAHGQSQGKYIGYGWPERYDIRKWINKLIRHNGEDSQAWVKENETGKHPVTKIEKLDALEAIKKYGDEVEYVIMSWAPDKGEIDWDVLQLLRSTYPEVKLLVIGEKDGATNSKKFWQEAQLSQDDELQKVNANLHSFDLIDEQIYLAK